MLGHDVLLRNGVTSFQSSSQDGDLAVPAALLLGMIAAKKYGHGMRFEIVRL
jgi:hypothetical protein